MTTNEPGPDVGGQRERPRVREGEASDHLNILREQTFVTNKIGNGVVSIAHIKHDRPGFQPTPAQEEALHLHFHLSPVQASVSIDGSSPAPLLAPAQTVSIKDLRRRLTGTI